MSRVRRSTKGIVLYCICAFLIMAILYFAYAGIRLQKYMSSGNEMVYTTTPYNRAGNGQKFLIIGDSLAYGVGTSSPENSLAGQIGQRFPLADISNKALVGEDIEGLANTVAGLLDKRYDKVFIFVGGNDVARYGIDLDNSLKRLEEIYKYTSQNTEQVYMYSTIDFNEVSAIPDVLHGYYSKRSQKLYSVSKSMASKYENINFVDSYNIDSSEYNLYEASDGFHLNDEGIRKIVELTFP